MPIFVKVIVVWTVILFFAICNGALREGVLIPKLGEKTGFLLSGLSLSLVILLVTYCFLPWIGIRTPLKLLSLGGCWLVFTLLFEFLFGFLRGQSLEQILGAYTFQNGNIWPIVLLVILLAPMLVAKLRAMLS